MPLSAVVDEPSKGFILDYVKTLLSRGLELGLLVGPPG